MSYLLPNSIVKDNEYRTERQLSMVKARVFIGLFGLSPKTEDGSRVYRKEEIFEILRKHDLIGPGFWGKIKGKSILDDSFLVSSTRAYSFVRLETPSGEVGYQLKPSSCAH